MFHFTAFLSGREVNRYIKCPTNKMLVDKLLFNYFVTSIKSIC